MKLASAQLFVIFVLLACCLASSSVIEACVREYGEDCLLPSDYEACIQEIRAHPRIKHGFEDDVTWRTVNFGAQFCETVGEPQGCSKCVRETAVMIARMN